MSVAHRRAATLAVLAACACVSSTLGAEPIAAPAGFRAPNAQPITTTLETTDPAARVLTRLPIPSSVQPAAHVQAAVVSGPIGNRRPHAESVPPGRAAPGGVVQTVPENSFPIDLPTVLDLAGANNLQIALAVEQVREAYAKLQAARVLWIPSIVGGVGYNKHDGRIQDTGGQVLEVSRNSLFVGGGPVVSDAPLTGGSNGPARLFADLSVADVFFEPLVARQTVRQASMTRAVTFNDTLLLASVTYLALVQAAAETNVTAEAVANARQLMHLTKQFAKAGTGLEADYLRAQAEVAARRRQLLRNQERMYVVSAELARQLRLDPRVVLFPVDGQPTPIRLIDDAIPLDTLIAQGVSSRPEGARNRAVVAETAYRARQEYIRPLLPRLYVGMSGGGFGGGQSTFLGNFSDRTDFDAVATWELRNAGFGNRALHRQRASQNRQARLSSTQIRDAIAAEVSQAFHRGRFRHEQIEITAERVRAAAEALELNFRGIRGGQLRPIEAQQAIEAIASARRGHIEATVSYDEAQFELLRAIGQPPYAPGSGGTVSSTPVAK